ncbi:unnamed protein product [Rhizophagus irregularis]|nr:unnamed protein product [Rhizophagus irregularis]
MKHTEATLSKHPKKICKSNDGNAQITQFFSTQDSETSNTKRKLCVGLNDEKVKLYLRRIGFVTTFGGAPPPEIVARELFGDKIKSSFHWNDLNKKENDQLLDTLRSQAKWINDSTTFCVRSTECSTYVDGIGEVCKQCLNLKKLKVFLNAIDKPIPKEKNQKYTPLILYKNSPFYQYCKNANVMELLGYFNDPEDCTPKFWNQLARMDELEEQLEISVPVPKVPPFVLGIIPNNSENVSDVYEIHNQVLELAAHFKIHILSIGADGASIEIKAQKNIMQTNTQTKLEFNDELYSMYIINLLQH